MPPGQSLRGDSGPKSSKSYGVDEIFSSQKQYLVAHRLTKGKFGQKRGLRTLGKFTKHSCTMPVHHLCPLLFVWSQKLVGEGDSCAKDALRDIFLNYTGDGPISITPMMARTGAIA